MGDIALKGSIIGFEEYENYLLQDPFGVDSPFRLLKCIDSELTFLVANPYTVVEDYTFEIQDEAAESLGISANCLDRLAVLSIMRLQEEIVYINLRSPLLINTEKGLFRQIILSNEAYPVSAPFAFKAAQNQTQPDNAEGR